MPEKDKETIKLNGEFGPSADHEVLAGLEQIASERIGIPNPPIIIDASPTQLNDLSAKELNSLAKSIAAQEILYEKNSSGFSSELVKKRARMKHPLGGLKKAA